MKLRQFYVYILASSKNGTLYIGVTSDLHKRTYEHKTGEIDGFTKEYGVNNLVYFELHDTAESAITREKNMKAWKREWKIRLIEESNPGWRDRSEDF